MLENSRESGDIRVLTSIGNCHRKLKTFKEGIVYFEMALLREPNNFYALFGMADCYRGLGQQCRSLFYWNLILQQDPKNKVILTRAGDAYRIMDEYDSAVSYYQRALNVEFDTYAVLGLAMVAKAKGNYNECCESLKSLIKQDSRNYRLYLILAECKLDKGERLEAIEVLEDFQHLGIRNNAINKMLEAIKN
jgi:tetratricopeptide (TPR) repeat protein